MGEGLVIAGKYHVVQAIGQGGMGAVYDAIHAKTGRRVALKLIHERTILAGGPAARLRFEREARAAASIDSLHVVQVLDSGDDDRSGMPFIVMEFLQGNDLRQLLDKGPMHPRIAVPIALQIARGLLKAHEGDVIHRDLKPANVFLAKADGDRRIVKILDFGIAKIASEGAGETVELTGTDELVGSPPYMSPEQLRSPREVDHRSDLWSLGIVLYEMLSGVLPTENVHPIGARVYAICHVPTAPISTLVAGIPPSLELFLVRALAIDVKERFANAAAFIAALEAAYPVEVDLDERVIAPLLPPPRDPSSVPLPGPTVGLSVSGEGESESVAGSTTTRREEAARTRRRGWLLLLGPALLVLGLVSWIATLPRGASSDPVRAPATMPALPSETAAPKAEARPPEVDAGTETVAPHSADSDPDAGRPRLSPPKRTRQAVPPRKNAPIPDSRDQL